MRETAVTARGIDPAWLANDIGQDLSFLLARANAISLADGSSTLRDFGLKVRSYPILSLACGDLQPTQRDLAEALRLDPSQVVTLVDDLESRGFVERRTDARDRRSKVVVATATGREICAQARTALTETEHATYEALSADEQRQLADLLRRVAVSR